MAAARAPLISRLQRAAGGMLGRPPIGHPQMPMGMFLRGMGAMVARTGAEEMSCEECFAEMDRLWSGWPARRPHALGPWSPTTCAFGDCYEETPSCLTSPDE